MATSMDEDFLKLLIVGKTSEGKSSTGNNILGREVFKSSASMTSITKQCQREVAKVQGQNVMVVDSPGLADTDIKIDGGLERLGVEITSMMATQPDGFDAVLVVVRFDKRLTNEDKKVFEQLEAFFGKDYAKYYGILVVTHVDMYEPEQYGQMAVEEFLSNPGGILAEIREKCNNRVACFDNKTKDESVRQAQVKRLLDIVTKLKQSSGRYTPQIFVEAKRSRDEAYLKAKKPFIQQSTELSLKVILQELEDIPAGSTDTQKLKDIKENLQKQLADLRSQDKGSNILTEVISSVANLEQAVTARITAIMQNGDLASTSARLARETTAVGERLEASARDRFMAVLKTAGRAFVDKILPKVAKVLTVVLQYSVSMLLDAILKKFRK